MIQNEWLPWQHFFLTYWHIGVLHNYTPRSSYILNLTLIAWMMWKLFNPQWFGKIVVTIATLCLTDTKIMCFTFIPQGHNGNQIWLRLLQNCGNTCSSLCNILKKTWSCHGNALSDTDKNNILHIYTQIASYTQNLTFIAQTSHFYTKWVVTMAAHFFYNDTLGSCITTPQDHYTFQMKLFKKKREKRKPNHGSD